MFSTIVVGGGRWGQILAKNVVRDDRIKRVFLVSRRNLRRTQSWHETESSRNPTIARKLKIVTDLKQIIETEDIKFAIVANYPNEHYQTCRFFLERKISVLAEKPFVDSVTQFNELSDLAERNGLLLGVGLEYLFNQKIYAFKALLHALNSTPQNISVRWIDVEKLHRRGQLKVPDFSVNVFKDLYSHVWSILKIILDGSPIALKGIEVRKGGEQISGTFSQGDIPISIFLDRAGDRPDRLLTITDQNRDVLCLDFTKDQVTFSLNGNACPNSKDSNITCSPLMMELGSFLDRIEGLRDDLPNAISKLSELVDHEEKGSKMILEKQREIVGQSLMTGESESSPSQDVQNIIREHLFLRFVELGLLKNRLDTEEIRRLVNAAYKIIYSLSDNPFVLQETLSELVGMKSDELALLNQSLQGSEFIQEMITTRGKGSKYWVNTILPVSQQGGLDAVINNKFQYPYRIGIYPAVNCMFNCHFCGRSPEKYSKGQHLEGNHLIKQIFSKAPKDDPYRFYISGGLEPLTNPGIGELISFGANEGFRLSLYTNAFLLSRKFFDRHPGLWDLDVLRVSLYGLDDESYKNATGKTAAFQRVKQNLVELLSLRHERNVNMKVGLNLIILPNQAWQVPKVLDLITDVNDLSGAPRGIDFLTLREDYTPADSEEKYEDHSALVSAFQDLRERSQHPQLKNLNIDYGYALHPISKGVKSSRLGSIQAVELVPKGYPQISIAVDLLGDVYLYREAAFIGRPGAHRYKIGRVTDNTSLENIVEDYIENGAPASFEKADIAFLDAFDHIVTNLIQQSQKDAQFGIPFHLGPVKNRWRNAPGQLSQFTVAHPTLVDLP